MKIGTWNEGAGGGGNGSGGAGGGNNSTAATFEIGTFNIRRGRETNDSHGGGGGGGHGSSSNNHFHSQSGNNIQGGPGIRETGIIEKLLVSYCCASNRDYLSISAAVYFDD
jgi:hypothetical protein